MEAKISMEGKSPALPSCGAPEPLTLEKSKKREVHSQSRAQSSERDRMVSMINQTLVMLPDIVNNTIINRKIVELINLYCRSGFWKEQNLHRHLFSFVDLTSLLLRYYFNFNL